MSRNIPDQIRDLSMGWDTENWGRSLPFFSSHLSPNLDGQTAIEVGCGASSGGPGVWLAWRKMNVVSTSILDVEEENKEFFTRCKLDSNYRFKKWDATKSWDESPVDIIVTKSVLGGICRNNNEDNLCLALDGIYKALKPGGHYLFAENLLGSSLHRFFGKRYGAGKNGWHYFTKPDLNDFLSRAGFEVEAFSSTGFTAAFGRSEKQKRILGRVDGVIARFIPPSWNYIGFGVAKKPE